MLSKHIAYHLGSVSRITRGRVPGPFRTQLIGGWTLRKECWRFPTLQECLYLHKVLTSQRIPLNILWRENEINKKFWYWVVPKMLVFSLVSFSCAQCNWRAITISVGWLEKEYVLIVRSHTRRGKSLFEVETALDGRPWYVVCCWLLRLTSSAALKASIKWSLAT